MSSRKKIILWIILMLCLITILFLIYYGRSLRLSQKTVALPVVKELPQPLSNPLAVEIPEEVYYYTGTIKKKGDRFLVISAAAADNFLVADQEFIARIDEATRMLKYKIPVYLKPGQSPKEFAVNQGHATFADFNVGDRVTVYARENVKGKTEFIASEIRAVEYGE